MSTKKAKQSNKSNQKTFNTYLYEFICARLKLKRREKIIFFRLLGFLLRNDKPFPYRSTDMTERTGYSRSSIFESLNLLEKFRLIERIGLGDNRRFLKGSIMIKACTTVQNRIKRLQLNNSTTVQKLDSEIAQPSRNWIVYKTSFILKHKEGRSSAHQTQNQKPEYLKYHEYRKRLECDIDLKLKPSDTRIMNFEEWLAAKDSDPKTGTA